MLGTLFFTFVKIGMFTIGGGYAMIPLIEREVVDRGWIGKEDFLDLFAVTQSLPGIFAVNISIFVGYRLRGVWGSVVATVAVCLPSFLLVLAISYFFARFKSNTYVEAAFTGLRPMTVGLIAAAGLLLVNHENFIDWKSVVIFAGAFFLTWKYKMHPILVICLAGAAGLFIYW